MNPKVLKHPKWDHNPGCETFTFPDGEVTIRVPEGENLTVAHGVLMLERVKFHLLTLMEK